MRGPRIRGSLPDMRHAPIVVKVGGSLEEPIGLLDDIAAHHGPLILVHGAHRVLDRLAVRLGHPPRFVTSMAARLIRAASEGGEHATELRAAAAGGVKGRGRSASAARKPAAKAPTAKAA